MLCTLSKLKGGGGRGLFKNSNDSVNKYMKRDKNSRT